MFTRGYIKYAMDISNYIIKSATDDNRVLLYSTFSTAFIVLTNKDYEKVFVNKEFDDCEHLDTLIKLGFIVNDNEQQRKLLENLSANEVSRRDPVIKIFSTNRCNARCYYCFEEGINFVDMTDEMALQVVSFIKQYYSQYPRLQINWFGGEPLMNFKAIRIITDELIASGYELTTHVTTNGSLINEEIIEYFKSHYGDISFQVTIDDIGKAYYKIKKYVDLKEETAFDIVINNTRLLLSKDISTRIRINFLKERLNHAIEIFDYLNTLYEGLPSPTIYFAPISFDHLPQSRKRCNDKSSEHTHLSLMKFYTDRNILFDESNLVKNTLSNLSLKPKAIPCGSCRTHNLTITAEGLIFKCHRIVTDPQYAIGDVFKGVDYKNKFYRIFMTDEFEDPKCKECNVFPICRGGCKIESIIYDKRVKTCEIFSRHSELVKMYYDEISSNE